MGSIPGLGRSPGVGNGNLLRHDWAAEPAHSLSSNENSLQKTIWELVTAPDLELVVSSDWLFKGLFLALYSFLKITIYEKIGK